MLKTTYIFSLFFISIILSACVPPQRETPLPLPTEPPQSTSITSTEDPSTIAPSTHTATPLPTETDIAELPTNTPVALPSDTPAIPSTTAPTETFTATPLEPTNTPILAPTATPIPLPTATPASQSMPAIALQPIAEGFEQPVYLTHAGDHTGRLFVVERHGKIRIIQNGVPLMDSFMDIDGIVGSEEQEQGLLSIAFHPNFLDNHRFFINYTNNDGDTVISSYQTTNDLMQANPITEKEILLIEQPYGNHNGGQLQFGPDGYLYIGMGDGGLANDPFSHGQNVSTLLGKMLRLDINTDLPYLIPPSNPFIGQTGAAQEVWAYGFRNPWRFSFDRQTGDMYIADVGQNSYEEVDFEPAGSAGGLNYGWNIMESRQCFQGVPCQQDGLVLPVAEYGRDKGCSITGGYVYRGPAFPALQGIYFYGDYCTGNIWGLRVGSVPVLLFESGLNISSFGEDQNGELYLVDLRGGVYQVILHP